MKFELVPTLAETARAVLASARAGTVWRLFSPCYRRRTENRGCGPAAARHGESDGKTQSVLEFVEAWLELEAESVAADTLEEATARLEALPFTPTVNTVKVGLTVLDDVGGGWTNRTMNDAARFQTGKSLAKTGWLSVNLWTSEAPNLEELRRVVLEAVRRAAYVTEQGDPHTLGEMMRQEGRASAFAGRTVTFDAEELEYSRAVIEPYRSSTQQPTVIACLYGDDAARACGYAPLGLSKDAGFQVGLADALELQ